MADTRRKSKTDPQLVTIPPTLYLMMDGSGDPNGPVFQKAVSVLYTISYTIRFGKKEIPGYIPYTVSNLEGLWRTDTGKPTQSVDKQAFRWTAMIAQPEFVTKEVFAWAKHMCAIKKPELDTSAVRLETYDEGLCVQALHLGSFDTEKTTVDRISAFCTEQSLVEICDDCQPHHELYLNNPSTTAADKIKTIIRHPVRLAP